MNHPFDCITNFIFVENDPVAADIVLIPSGSRPQLMEKAVELYHQGLAPYILPSGGTNKKLPNWATEWDFLQNIAIDKGVPEEKILKEDRAQNTFDDATLSWKVIKQNNISVKKALFVCKEHHARRALLTYQTVFPSDVEFIVCPIADERNIKKDNWFLDEKKIEVVMTEVQKIGEYFGRYIRNWGEK
ncbi:MAG: YdcF family protein [bacterium]